MFWIVLFWVAAIVLALSVLVQVGYVSQGRDVPGVTSLRRMLEKENDGERTGSDRQGR